MFDDRAGRWIKVTRPWAAGFAVAFVGDEPLFLPATPREYLRRMLLQNLRFGDDVRFEGVLLTDLGQRLVISQPDVSGAAPDLGLMDRMLTDQHGFRRLNIPPVGYEHSFSYVDGSLALFDAHPANFVVSADILVPIDVILVELDDDATISLSSKIVS